MEFVRSTKPVIGDSSTRVFLFEAKKLHLRSPEDEKLEWKMMTFDISYRPDPYPKSQIPSAIYALYQQQHKAFSFQYRWR